MKKLPNPHSILEEAMKVIYEVSDVENDKTNLNIHKYCEDMYFALINIDDLVKREKTGDTNLTKEKILDFITDELFSSKIHEIR